MASARGRGMNRGKSQRPDAQAFDALKAAACEYAAWMLSPGRSFSGGMIAESKLGEAAIRYAVAREVVTKGTKR